MPDDQEEKEHGLAANMPDDQEEKEHGLAAKNEDTTKEAEDIRIRLTTLLHLCQQTTDIVVNTGWSTLVTIHQDKVPPLSFFISYGDNIRDVKEIIHKKLGMLPGEQHLTWNSQPVFSRIIPEQTPHLTLRLKHVRLDPKLGSLFQMVGLGDWKERDDIMEQFLVERNAKCCPACRQQLILMQQQQADDETDSPSQKNVFCSKCYAKWDNVLARRLQGMIENPYVHSQEGNDPLCRQCDFSLCNTCYALDEGRPAFTDPYQALESMACQIASHLATTATKFGGRGHLCGYPSVPWRHELGPKLFSQGAGIMVLRETKAMHENTRLRIVWRSDLSKLLTDSSSSEEYPKPKELMNTVMPKGVTVADMLEIRRRLRISPEFLGLANLYDGETSSFRPGLPTSVYETMKIKHYNKEEVLIELGIEVSDGDY